MTYVYSVAILDADNNTTAGKSYECKSENQAHSVAIRLLKDNPQNTIAVYKKIAFYVAKTYDVIPLSYVVTDNGEVLPK